MNWFLLAFVSAVFSAAAAVFEKKALFKLNALRFSFLVSFITLLFSLPFFLEISFKQDAANSLLILFIKSLLSGGAFYFVMVSIKKLEISEALPLLALSPGIIAVIGFLFIGDDLVPMEWFGIFMMVAGTYILELKKDTKNFFAPLTALFFSKNYIPIISALILFTLSSLLDRILLRDFAVPPFTFMAFQQLFYALIFFSAVLLKNKEIKTSFTGLDKNIILLLVLISVLTIVYRYTQIEATKLVPVALVISVKRLSVLMAVIIGGKLFNEKNLLKKIIAAVIILTGTILLGIS
ncbi:MAG: DMT family transporter [Ignavibacteriaceae bacterium]|nr:DMT family transporter [Ignavibacteriaceae bacterium]